MISGVSLTLNLCLTIIMDGRLHVLLLDVKFILYTQLLFSVAIKLFF